ncbi:hypothetical protein GOODEAATRI_017219, partial [Goodea atripinnis]
WDGVGPIPGLSQSLRGAELLWHPMVVKPYLNLLAESSNPATLEGAAGSLQNLSAGNWKVKISICSCLQFSAYIRAAVRKEKGLPILVELLRMDNDRVVCSVATALRNMALDGRNKELIGKYAMRDLVNRLPGGTPSVLSDDTVASVCCTLHEVTSRNMENAKALADSGGIEKLVDISKGRGKGYSMKVVKAAAQVLNTLWQYRELRSLYKQVGRILNKGCPLHLKYTSYELNLPNKFHLLKLLCVIYKQDGWNYTHFVTPVSTLERDRYRSQPTLPTSPLQMSPVIQSGSIEGTIRVPNKKTMHKKIDNKRQPFSLNKLDFFWSTSLNNQRPHHPEPFYDEPDRKNYNSYRMYLSSPQGYGEERYEDEVVHLPSSPDGYATQSLQFKANTNYVDFYSTTRRPSNRANKFTGSPDSWV